jgi:thiamine kinase-like enzyme
MNSLERKHFKPNTSNKYHIDCNELEKNPSILPIVFEKIILNKNDTTILQSILADKSITSKHKNIVVKIGKINKTIEKEYKIGKYLENLNLTGFINYICLFNCYDNTFNNIELKIKNLDKSLCSAKKDEDNLKSVVIMPYIQEGSIRNFKWNSDKYDVLKAVLLQTVMSVFIVYQLCGFLHNDLHLDNILIKKTKKEMLTYQLEDDKKENVKTINIETYGYKIVIMDFESSMLVIKNKDGLRVYWNNLLNMFSRLHYDLKNKDGDRVAILDLSNITSFIEKQEILNSQIIHTLQLLDMIKKMKFIVIEQIKSKLVYNPNIF